MSYRLVCCKIIEFLLCCYIIMDFIPKMWKRIRILTNENLKKFKNINYKKENQNPNVQKKNCDGNTMITSSNSKIKGKVSMIARQWEDHEVSSLMPCKQRNVINIGNDSDNPSKTKKFSDEHNSMNDDFESDQISKNFENNENNETEVTNKEMSISHLCKELLEKFDTENKENDEKSNVQNNVQRRNSKVSEIAKIFEMNENKSRIHMTMSKVHNILGNYFEGSKNNVSNNEGGGGGNGYADQTQQQHLRAEEFEKPSHELKSELEETKAIVNKLNKPATTDSDKNESLLCDKYDDEKQSNGISNEHSVLQKEPFNKNNEIAAIATNDGKQNENSFRSLCSAEQEVVKERDSLKSPQPPAIHVLLPSSSLSADSSSFASSPSAEVKLRNHMKVQTVEDILSQQRFSRRLSAYSISEFLKDSPNDDETDDVDQIINDIGK